MSRVAIRFRVMGTLFTLAGGDLAGATIAVEEELCGRVHPLLSIPDAAAPNDARSNYLVQVSKDQQWIYVMWPSSRGVMCRRKTAIYRRNGQEFIFTGEGRNGLSSN